LLAGASQVELHATRLDDLLGPLEIRANRLLGLGENVIYAFAVDHGGTELAKGRLTLVRPGVGPALGSGSEGR
jgi:predicted hotdog family 3-hydroxylacyl-ACP dehydratase